MGLFDNLVNNVANAAVQTVQDAAQPYVDTANNYLNQAQDALNNVQDAAQNALNDFSQGLENFNLPALPDMNQLVNTGVNALAQTAQNALYQPGAQVPSNMLPGIQPAVAGYQINQAAAAKNVMAVAQPAQTANPTSDFGSFLEKNGMMIMLGIAGVVVLMMATA